ncbi:MAG: hypothetical protein ACR2M0_02000 [Chloroflexia bacterium]
MSSNHDEHGTHAPEHGIDTEGVPATVAEARTPLRAFIWPGVITLIVLFLIWGPVTGAFSLYNGGLDANGKPTATIAIPIESPTTAANLTPLSTAGASPAPALASAVATPPATTPTSLLVTDTPPAAITETPPATTGASAVVPPTDIPPPPPATPSPAGPVLETAVPAAGSPTPGAAGSPPSAHLQNDAPRSLSFGGKKYNVAVSDTTLPNWSFSKDPSVASWAGGTNVNYILGIAYSPENAALFAASRPADTITLTGADGTVYTYVVDQVGRVSSSDVGKLAQDHPAITVLLLGDPAGDRALVQGHFRETASTP